MLYCIKQEDFRTADIMRKPVDQNIFIKTEKQKVYDLAMKLYQ